jgi:hypothetical protein
VVSISGSSAICVGQTATLVANGANTYTWSNASTASIITLSPASNTSYSLTGTAAGCIGSATTNLTVNANPIITVNSEQYVQDKTSLLIQTEQIPIPYKAVIQW